MTNQIKIGIVGGGQLARMMTFAAKKLGMYVAVIDPTPDSPAGQVADHQIVAGYKDAKAVHELASLCDYVTVDAEFVNDEVLEEIKTLGKNVAPFPSTIKLIKDKLKQKEFLKKNGIATADFIGLTPLSQTHTSAHLVSEIEKAGEVFGYPLLVKARFDAYDGKGNVVVTRKDEIPAAIQKLEGRDLYVEKFVNFTKELAVMIARSFDGKIAVYPVVETTHNNNICDTVIAPAPVFDDIQKQAQRLAIQVMEHMHGAGVFGIEMFLDNKSVMVNEIAPRVHNSGHYTIEACVTSQFEQHIRAIARLPLGSTKMVPKVAVMKNILGEKEGNGIPSGLSDALTIENVSLHIYGKYESRVGRKMGHITVVGDTIDECLKKAEKARGKLKI